MNFNQTKHGYAVRANRHPLYNVWQSMKQRCLNPNSPERYKYYGGRGITVCKEWCSSAEIFIKWALTHGYKKGLTLERVNNNRGYSPENCVFTTRHKNQLNRRRLSNPPKSKTNKLPLGVVKSDKKFRARISINGKERHLGCFKTAQEAHLAYIKVQTEYAKK